MRRLFKEVFKSLAKNKITMICLTILIFITSGIFTLFFNIKTSYTSTVNSYNKVSRLHDLSVDLDVNPAGNIPNGGFDLIDKENKVIEKSPSEFNWDNEKSHVDYTLSLPKEHQEYIPLKDTKPENQFENWTFGPSFDNYYIRTKDFLDFYKNSKLNSNVKFDIDDYSSSNNKKLSDGITFDQARRFSLSGSSDYTFPLFKKIAGKEKFVNVTKEEQINNASNFVFNSELKLSNIAQFIYNTNKKSEYLINPVSLYLNVKENKASINIDDYNKWKDENALHVIKGSDLLNMLGFYEQEPNSGKFYFNKAKQDSTDTDIKLSSGYTSIENNINANDKIASNFKLINYLLTHQINNNALEYASITAGNYLLPSSWVRKRTITGKFLWYRYKLNWDEQLNNSNWKGSYLKYINNLKQTNSDKYDELRYFSIWTKKITTKYEHNGKINTNEEELSLHLDEDINKNDLNIKFLPADEWDGKPLLGLKNNWVDGKKYKSILEIESVLNPSLNSNPVENAKKLISSAELKNNQTILKDGASQYARLAILKEIVKEVGEENIGIRQTLTIETIDELTKIKNVFHFINTGDKDQKIKGIKQNVGKLQEEAFNKTILHSSINNKDIDEFLLKSKDPSIIKKLPPVYTKEIINAIFDNYTPDFNYFVPDIRYVDYYDYYENTRFLKTVKNGKLLLLTDEADAKVSEGAKILGAITKVDTDKYIVLKNENNRWIKDNSWFLDKHYFTLDELYQQLVIKGLTIKAEIGKDGWAWVNPTFKNSLSLPVAFGSINTDLTNDIIQNKSVALLIEYAKKILYESDLMKIISKDALEVILYSAQKAIEDNGYHEMLSVGKSNPYTLTKVLFDLLNNLIISINNNSNSAYKYANINGEVFIKSTLNNIIDYFEKQYLDSGSTIEERDQKFVDILNKFLGLLDFNLENIFPSFLNIKLRDLFKFFKDKSQVFIFFKNLIDSINFSKFSSLIQDWYKKYPLQNLTDNKRAYWVLSSHQIVVDFLKSVDSNKFRTTMKNIINNVDFNKILNPNIENSLFDIWKKANQKANVAISADDEQNIKTFFINLSAYDITNPALAYKNVSEGLSEIIDNISVEKFANTLEGFLKNYRWAVEANAKVYDNFNTKTLSDVDYLSAFVSSMVSSNNGSVSNKVIAIQNALIKLANLSFKTQEISKTLKLNIPADEPGKISLTNLLALTKLSFPNNNTSSTSHAFSPYDEEKIKDILGNINISIANKMPVELNKEEIAFLTNYVLIQEDEFNNLDTMKQKVEYYLEFIKKLKINNFKTNSEYKFDSAEASKDILSYADLGYFSSLINEESTIADKPLLSKLHSVLAKYLGSMIGKGDGPIIDKTLNLYSMWIKLAYELNALGEKTVSYVKNPYTGENEKVINKKNDLTYDQITFILKGLLNLAKDSEVANLFNSFEEVKEKLPGIGILGSQPGSYDALALQLSLAHTETNKLVSNIEKIFNTNAKFQNYFNSLKASGIELSDKNIQDFKSILLKHKYELVYNFGYIASANMMPTFYLSALEKFVSTFINNKDISADSKLKPLITNNFDFDLVYKMTLNASKTSQIFSIINLPSSLMNPLIALSFPQILLSYLLSNNPNEGNAGFIVRKLFSNLTNMNAEEIRSMLLPLFDKFLPDDLKIENKSDANIVIDLSWFNYLITNKFRPNNEDLEFYGLNLTKTFKDVLYKIIQPISIYNLISYTDAGSYLAKVNYGYLNKNNKEVYKGDLSKYLKSPLEMQRFVDSLDAKYKVRINTIEYVIIGVDTTADYLYPAINESNLQVDTKTQALLYVNQKGFDRIYSAYPTFALKEYVLVKAPSKLTKSGKEIYQIGKTPADLKNIFNKIISSVSSSNSQKVYLNNEVDYLNPERSIRVTTTAKLISTIKSVTFYAVFILIILVAFIVYFIVKRYIEDRNKVIGILLAQGYTTKEIAISFCAFGWIPTLIGTIFGYITGLLLQSPTMKIFSIYWTLENKIISFSLPTLLFTIIVPFVLISLLIFLITWFSVRKKPTELMSGLVEVSIGNFSQKIMSIFRRSTIKFKYIISTAINNFWKFISLLLAFSTTSLITMLFMSTGNVFNKSINQTYENRNYRYKLDLETPTTEGGPFVTYNKNDLSKYLYVPNDLSGGGSSSTGSQLDYQNPNFFRPGYNFNTDVKVNKFDPVVLTKSSLDLLLDMSVSLSPWDITYANMPETQRARVTEIFKRVSKAMEQTQNLVPCHWTVAAPGYMSVKDINKYYADQKAGLPEDLSNRQSFFAFTTVGSGSSSDGLPKFKLVEWNPETGSYAKPVLVSTSKYRIQYRNFLTEAYKKINLKDFFVSFGGIYWNDSTNEKYTYADVGIGFYTKKSKEEKNKDYKIYGYQKNSKFVKIYSEDGKNLTQALENYNWDENNEIPLVVNHVTSKILGISEGSILNANIKNHVNRFLYRALGKDSPRVNYKFKIIGVSNTYINNEFITRKDILDKILGFDSLTRRLCEAKKDELDAIKNISDPKDYKKIEESFIKQYEAFNGILSNDETPVQTIDTLTTYSPLGYWGASATFDVDGSDNFVIWDFFKRIFLSDGSKFTSAYEHMVKSYNEYDKSNLDYKETLLRKLKITNDQFNEMLHTKNPSAEYVKLARDVLNEFFGIDSQAIYGKNIMYGASFNVDSKDIEVGFISGISQTTNTILSAFIVLSFAISIIILVVITHIMITSSQRSIAIFSILGYSNKEKVFLFFFNFIPIIVLACLFMIPVTYGFITVLNKFMMATSQIVLPIKLYVSTVLLSLAVCLSIFTITSIITWNSINKAKAIDVLKGK